MSLETFTTAGKIRVMSAWHKNKPSEIQFRKRSDIDNVWYDMINMGEPTWNWKDIDYRIKPSKHA